MISDCVVVEASGNEKLESGCQRGTDCKRRSSTKDTRSRVTVTDIPEETREGEQITACLAFLPSDVKDLSSTGCECYFVNDSNYWLFFSYMSRERNSWKVVTVAAWNPTPKSSWKSSGKNNSMR